MQLEIDKTAITSSCPVEKFNFDILLRDKYPFQPPLVMTRTRFGKQSLADGRDLLTHVLPDGHTEWSPGISINQVI